MTEERLQALLNSMTLEEKVGQLVQCNAGQFIENSLEITGPEGETLPKDELNRVNELRRQVNDLHVAGKPEVFKPGFSDELRDFIHNIWEDPNKEIVVAESNGTVCGFAVLNHIVRPENPFMYPRDFLDIDEFGVDTAFRRLGAGAVGLPSRQSHALAQQDRPL